MQLGIWLVVVLFMVGCAPRVSSSVPQRTFVSPIPIEPPPPTPDPTAWAVMYAPPAEGMPLGVAAGRPDKLQEASSAGGGEDGSALPLRPEGSPDVVIIAFSGHCGAICRTVNTHSYLDDPDVEAVQAVARIFQSMGLSVQYLSASSFVEAHSSAISRRMEPGYLEAQAYLDFVREKWIAGVANPTRVVLLAHSHGTVWASLLALNNLEVTFDYFLSLDAVCWQWWRKHRGFITRTYAERGLPLPFPLEEGDDPCEVFAVPGQRARQDITDVVPANVIYGLEVRSPLKLLSLSPNLIRDDDPNMRINGSRLGLWSITASQNHSAVDTRYQEAMDWITVMLVRLGLPSHDTFDMQALVLPPPPEGYSYRQ